MKVTDLLAIQTPLKWAGVAVITIASLVVYQPALAINFWTDDYWLLGMVLGLPLPDYLRAFFDPSLQWRFYRPMQGVQWGIGNALFHTDPTGYHFLQILLFASGAVLLFLIVARVTKKLFVGMLAAFAYLTIPIDSLAVFWPGVVDPLLALFYLLTIWYWLDYMENGSIIRYGLTLAMFVAALLSKEVAVTLPAVLFLADRWLIHKKASFWELVRRYALILALLVPYALLEFHAVSQGLFTTQLGYGPGLHIISTLMLHLSNLMFPWAPPFDLGGALLMVAIIATVILVRKRQFGLLFLECATLLTLLPILPFQPNMAAAGRYLYLPLMGSAVAFALLVDWLLHVSRSKISDLLPRAALAGLIPLFVWSGATIAYGAESFGNASRAERTQFRAIFQKHPAFSPGTYLYFLYPPDPDIASIMFVRYGAAIQADSTESGHPADLRNRTSALVMYLDDDNAWREQLANKNTNVRSLPTTPVQFGDSIQLEGFELVNDEVRQGEDVIAILYWRTNQKVDRDYTVFTHVVDREGKLIAGSDKQPANGSSPTSRWRTGATISDAAVVTLPSDAPVGSDYWIEIGLYDLTTLQRLALVDPGGQGVTDKIVIGPIQVVN